MYSWGYSGTLGYETDDTYNPIPKKINFADGKTKQEKSVVAYKSNGSYVTTWILYLPGTIVLTLFTLNKSRTKTLCGEHMARQTADIM